MLLTKRLPSPLRPRRTLVRRGDEDASSNGGELRNAEGGTGRSGAFLESTAILAGPAIDGSKILPQSEWRRFENTRYHPLRDAAVEPDVRPKGGRPRNHRHQHNRKQRLVPANELNENWHINQQCFSTNPVARHAQRARYQVESRRGVEGDRCGSCLSISVDVHRHFERCSATEYGCPVPIVLRSAPALPPCGSRFFQIGNEHGLASKKYRRG